MAAPLVTPHRYVAARRYQFRRTLRRTTSATLATRPMRRPMGVTLPRAASATIRDLTAEPRLTQVRSVSHLVTRNTAGASISVAAIVTTTPRGCRNDDRSAHPAPSNTSPPETTPAPLVITTGGRSAAIWISRVAGDVI